MILVSPIPIVVSTGAVVTTNVLGGDSGNASDRDDAPDRDNDRYVRPRVRDGSLAHVDSCDDKHRDLATNGQLTDRDRLVGEGHLYI